MQIKDVQVLKTNKQENNQPVKDVLINHFVNLVKLKRLLKNNTNRSKIHYKALNIRFWCFQEKEELVNLQFLLNWLCIWLRKEKK